MHTERRLWMMLAMKRYGVAVIALCLLLLTAGCQRGKDSSEPSGTATTGTVPSLLDVDLSTLLTSEQVGTALGVAVGQPELLEEGTHVRYSSEDLATYAEIGMMSGTREIYDATVAYYSDAADSANLGEVAKWSAQTSQLLVFGKGYLISVTAAKPDQSADGLLVAARQIAALILEKL